MPTWAEVIRVFLTLTLHAVVGALQPLQKLAKYLSSLTEVMKNDCFLDK